MQAHSPYASLHASTLRSQEMLASNLHTVGLSVSEATSEKHLKAKIRWWLICVGHEREVKEETERDELR